MVEKRVANENRVQSRPKFASDRATAQISLIKGPEMAVLLLLFSLLNHSHHHNYSWLSNSQKTEDADETLLLSYSLL